jgi:CubicO group peptidase (beta-lactamase class C family)
VVEMLINQGELDFEPGADATYSNGGYVLLARLAEAASGSSMATLVHDRIATTLGLDTVWVITQYTPDPFERAIGTKRNGRTCDYGTWTTGAGGIAGSAEDLVIIGDAWQEGALVPSELVEEAFSPMGPALSDDAVGNGLGWFVGERTQGRVVWHTGHYAGFVNVWLLAPEADLAIAVLSNGSISRAADVAEKLLEHPDLQ